MAEMTLVIDPDGSSFALHDRANGRWMTAFNAPVPETKSQWASSIDTEGERRAALGYANRTITATVYLQKSTAALLQALENDLGEKIAKLAREGGVLRLGISSGDTISFDVEEASMQRVWAPAHVLTHLAQYEVSFICRPFGYGAEQDLGDNSETTLPALVFSDTVPGDVDGLGRLVVDDDSANNQWFAAWAVESDADYTHTTSSGSGGLFYQAESRTPLGGAAAIAVASASGGTVVRQGTLTTDWLAMLSTQASGGGAHLSHVGTFNVFARIMMPTANTGEVSVAFEYAQGDFLRNTTTGSVTFEADHAREGQWIFQRLGQVTIRKPSQGSHRWEGRIVAKSSVLGDDLDVDYIALFPTHGYGEAMGVQRTVTPTSAYLALDEFTSTTSGGTVGARVAPVGGTWATSGATTDFTFEDSPQEAIERNTTSDSGSGRFAILGSTNYTNTQVEVKISTAGTPAADTQVRLGVIVRWTDSSNFVQAYYSRSIDSLSRRSEKLFIQQTLAGATTTIATVTINPSSASYLVPDSTFHTLRLIAYSGGLASVELLSPAGTLLASCQGSSTDLATGGTLATGKPGIVDRSTSTGAVARDYDDFVVAVPAAPDAAIFASQSLQISHESAEREDNSGTYWNTMSSYKGDYLRLPPAGNEGRSTRLIVKACRNDPDTGIDTGIDDISARLFVTPRFLVVPD